MRDSVSKKKAIGCQPLASQGQLYPCTGHSPAPHKQTQTYKTHTQNKNRNYHSINSKYSLTLPHGTLHHQTFHPSGLDQLQGDISPQPLNLFSLSPASDGDKLPEPPSSCTSGIPPLVMVSSCAVLSHSWKAPGTFCSVSSYHSSAWCPCLPRVRFCSLAWCPCLPRAPVCSSSESRS